MSARTFAFGTALAALLPVAGSTALGVRALAPFDVVVDGLDDPRGLAVDSDDNVFVAERARGTVLRVSSTGRRTIVARGLKRPFGLAVDAEARVVVSEEGGGRLLRLDPTGPRTLATGLRQPRWVAIADSGAIYVIVQSSEDDDADGDTRDAIVTVGPDGGITPFVDGLSDVEGLVANGRAVYVLLRGVDGQLEIRRYAVTTAGTAGVSAKVGTPAQLRRAAGLARDALGAMWVSTPDADAGGVRIRDAVLKLTPSQAVVFAEGFDEPRDLAFGLEGHLYVNEGRAGRVLRFRPPAPPSVDPLPPAVTTTAVTVSGTATGDSRIDLFVNDADLPTTTLADGGGHFAGVVVIAQSAESHVEVYTTAARGDGLSSAPTVVSIVHDGEEPDLVFVRPLSAAFVRRSVPVEVDARDDGSGIARVTLDAGGRVLTSTLSPPPPAAATRAVAVWDTAGQSDGVTTLTARAADRAGNERAVTRAVVVDNTAPTVDIVEGPGGDTPESSVTFRFAGDDNLTPAASLVFTWRVDEGEFGTFTAITTATITSLGPGPHRLEVKARDLAGNESVPAVRTFAVVPGPVIVAVLPGAAAVGSTVTIVGERLDVGAVAVAFNGVRAAMQRLSPTSLLTSVPPGATSGPLTVATAAGTATRSFTVEARRALGLTALPITARTVPGLPVTVSLTLDDIGTEPFTGLAALAVTQAPPDVRSALGAPTLTGGRSTTLTLQPVSSAGTSGPVVIEATAVVDGATVRHTTTVELDVVPIAATALGGRLVLVDETPIVGARLTLAGATRETDAAGNFLFVDAPSGRHMLGVDVDAARPGLPIYAIDVELAAGTPTLLPTLRITPPPPPERFVAIDNSARDQIIGDDRLPGFALTLPAGVTITGWDGVVKRQVAVGLLTADTLPVPPPDFPARTFYQIFFGTPMGGLPSQPLPITLPNDQDLRPGESAEIWYYDAAPIPGVVAGWRLAGDATVTADGARVVSNPGVGLARFCGVCGIACIKRKVDGRPNVALKGPRGGDPVDLATGLFVLGKTDLALPGRIPAFVHRVYNAVDPFGRVAGFELATGPGWTLSVDVALLDDGPDARLLIMPGNARLGFARTEATTFVNSTLPDLAGAVLQTDAGGHRLTFQDGAWWRFAGGWRVRGRAHLELGGLGLLVEQRDRHGNVLTIERDAFGTVTRITEPGGRVLTFTTALLDVADPTSARLLGVVDPLGRVVQYGYDDARRLVSVTDAAGGVVRYEYDAAGRLAAIADPRGITYLRNAYDGAGRVIQQTQADGGVWRFDYDGPVGAHTRASVTDPRGAVTTHRFVAGRPVAIIDALGQTTRTEHDATGRVTAVADSIGRTVALGYDARGNVAQLIDPLGGTRSIEYDAADRPQSVADALGVRAHLSYDGGGRLVSVVDAANVPLVLEIDALGQPVAVRGASDPAMTVEYAATGEATALIDPLGHRTVLEYDAASRLIRRRDPSGGVVDIAYDALDRVVQVADASGVIAYEYDANGNLRAVADQLGRSVRYEYDVMDRRISRTDPTGATEHYERDAMGNVVRIVDRKGQIAVHEYDPLGRRVVSRYADGTIIELTYDSGGRLVRAAADGDAVLLEYDALDRLTAETSIFGTARYGWDARGRRATLTGPDGRVLGYEYDGAGRLTRIADDGRSVEIDYDGSGRRRRLRLPGGIDAEYQYDAASRLTGLAYRRAEQSLGDLVYGYDNLDRRIAISGSLASVLLPQPVESVVYDEANRPQRAGDRAFSFDANGNLTLVAGPGSTRAFAWDALDRLAAAGTDGRITSFAYDALGRRTARDDDEGRTMFVHDVTDVVRDLASSGARDYLRGIARDELFAVADRVALADGLGSLLALVDADGEISDTLRYEPFGRTISSAPTSLRYGFTGREREDEDLYYFRARYYHAGLGRFISEDPLGLPSGVNAYVYGFNDPVNVVDPTGLRTYVLHGVWPERAAFDDFAAALRTADPHTQTLPWNGRLFGGVMPATEGVAAQLMRQIVAELDDNPIGAAEKLNLVGFSGGGLLAVTLAEMLRARGVKVDTVVTMGTPAQTPLTTAVPAQTRLLNFIGVADPLVSLRLHPRGTNYLILATHRARSYTENDAVLALVRRAIAP